MMKILVLGGAGMLGHKVVQRLVARTPDVWWTLRGGVDDAALAPVPLLSGERAIQRFDALRLDDVSALLDDLRPDAVVNCLGVIKQRAEAADAISSITINALLPHRVAATIQQWGGRLIHISTDCVFSGRRGDYTENDDPDATDIYGSTKALGEVRAKNVVTLRTSMIGRELRHHKSLLDWFLRQRGGKVRGYRRAIWSGVTTPHLADTIESMLLRPQLSGIYQVSSGRVSKYELLQLLRSNYDLDVEIEPDDTVCCDRSLDGSHFEGATGYRCPPLSVLIRDLLSDPTPYPTPS